MARRKIRFIVKMCDNCDQTNNYTKTRFCSKGCMRQYFVKKSEVQKLDCGVNKKEYGLNYLFKKFEKFNCEEA